MFPRLQEQETISDRRQSKKNTLWGLTWKEREMAVELRSFP
jgi:hypothetical protein